MVGVHTYDVASNTITSTGGTAIAPITADDLHAADIAVGSTLDLTDRDTVTATDGAAVDFTQVMRPADDVAMGGPGRLVNVFIDNWTGGMVSTTIQITGTDFDGSPQTEDFNIVLPGAHPLTLLFKTLTSSQVTAWVGGAGDSYDYRIYQSRWGVFWKQGTDQYRCDAKIDLSDDIATPTYFAETRKQILVSDFIGAGETWLRPRDGSHLTLGTIIDAGDKTSEDGVSIVDKNTGIANFYMIRAEAGAEVNIYSSSFSAGITDARIELPTGSKIWNTVFGYGVKVIDSGAGVSRLACSHTNYPVHNCQAIWTDCFLMEPVAYFLLSGALAGSFTRIMGRGATGYGFRCESLTTTPVFTDCDLDLRTVQWIGGGANTGNIHWQYTINLQVLDKNGAAINGTLVELYNGIEANVMSINTGVDGKIIEQDMLVGTYDQPHGSVFQDNGPYTLIVTKAGYMPFTLTDFAWDEPISWRIYLRDQLSGDAVEGNVVLGKTFYSNDADTKLTGTSPGKLPYFTIPNARQVLDKEFVKRVANLVEAISDE